MVYYAVINNILSLLLPPLHFPLHTSLPLSLSPFHIPSELNAGLVGLGLTYTISLASICSYCVQQSAEVENIVRSRIGFNP